MALRVSRALLRDSVVEWGFPVRTLVGAGARSKIAGVLGESGARRPLVVTDAGLAGQGFFQELLRGFERDGLRASVFAEVHPNPLDRDVALGADAYRRGGCDSIVCVGGGSGLDGGKCVAMVAESGLRLQDCDYFAQAPALPAGGRLVPCVTVPTTAGTGAEMDSGSMYTDTEAKVKRCAGHAALPLTAVLDPELSLGLPPSLTAWTGMDALVHAMEAFLAPGCHPMCDSIALAAMQKIQRNLLRAVADGSDLEARHEMLMASAMAAVAFQKGLGAVHGLSEPLGAVYGVHHGLTNAVLLPYVLRDLGAVIEDRCADIAHALRLPPGGSRAGAVVAWIGELSEQLAIPSRLRDVEPSLEHAAPDDISELARKAAANPTGFTNFVRWDVEDYARILRIAI